MPLRVAFRPEAQADILHARRWYGEQEAGLGEEFAAAVEAVVERIQAMPKMYVAVLRNVRRAKLRKFPYLLYYRAFDIRIEVVAVLHGSRAPRTWQDRII